MGESYSGIRALADFIHDVTKYQRGLLPLVEVVEVVLLGRVILQALDCYIRARYARVDCFNIRFAPWRWIL